MNKKGIQQTKRLFTLMIVLLCCFVGRTAYGQTAQVSLKMNNVKLLQAIKEIEKQTKLLFVYTADVDVNRTISIDVKNQPLKSVLDQMFRGTNVVYKYEHPNVLLSVRKTSNAAIAKDTIRGTVYDELGIPLPGATVIVVGTNRGTTTSAKGTFRIMAAAEEILEIQYLGYEKQQVRVTPSKTQMKINLVQNKDVKVDEVVVIGYGTVKKSDMTGSVSNIKMSDIKDAPVLSVDQAMQGRVAGADIMSTTGEPGATTSIRIRGTRSVSASNEPLIVVDGVMDAVSDLSDINSADIASISILKDASSTAIYGSRGSNGVIIITTKQGRSPNNKPSITVKGDFGFSQLPRNLDIMDQSEFAQYRNDYSYFRTDGNYGNIDINTPQQNYPYPNPLSLGKGTNWIDEITHTAPYQNYNISASGSNKATKYYASLGYNDTRGIVENSGMSRISGRLNLDHQLLKWLKIGYKGAYTFRDQDMNLAEIGGSAYYRSALYLSPMLDKNSDYNPLWGNGQKINTPRSTIDQNTYNIKRLSTSHTAYFEVKLAKNLIAKSQNSYYFFKRNTFRYYPSTLPAKNEGEGGEAWRAEFDEHSLSSENTVTYNFKTKSGHQFDALGGFIAYKYKSNNLSLSGKGYMDDDVKWNNMNAVLDKQTYSASTSYTDKAKMSLLARLNYNYKQKYYLTVTGRYDGASNFASNNKWGFFPSAALKWNIAKEPFMKNIKWIEEMSIRLSAGRSGNDAIGAYRSMAALSSTTGGYIFGGSQPAAYYPSRLDSPNLTWEKTDLYNAALDLSFLKGRLSVTAEAYISKTNDLLLTVQTPLMTGYSSRFANLGKTTNKGLELSVESRNISRKNFSWSTNLTFAHNEQMVDDIGTEDFVVAAKSAGNNPYMMYGYVKGYPLNALWGFRYGGVWKSVDEFERNATTKAYASATIIQSDNTSRKNALGQPRYYDINRDGTLSQEDLVYLGSADPWLYGGLQNNFSFGALSLGVYFTYSLGGKIYNYSELYMGGSHMTNQYRYMLDSWHPVRNPQSNYPRAGAFDCDVPSDRMVYDATYLRLKNVSVSYAFDMRKKSKLVRDITVSVSGENLYLWKKYNGFDPDVSSEDGSALRRLDMGAYPKPRTIVFSVQLRY